MYDMYVLYDKGNEVPPGVHESYIFNCKSSFLRSNYVHTT